MRGDARRIPALLRRGERSPVVSGGGAGVPVNTAPPVVTGTVEIGEVLSCTTGTWANSPTSYAYQWQRDGVDISGATASTHTVVDGDIGPGTGGVGTGIRCVVTPTNGSGSGTPEPSNALAFDHAAYLPDTAIGVSTAGLTLADSDTTVDSWAATLGGVACTVAAPTSSDRPDYDATGGVGSRPRVVFDGVGEFLNGRLTKGSAFDDYEWGFVGDRASFNSAFSTLIGYATSSGGSPVFSLQDSSSTTLRASISGAVFTVSTTNPTNNTQHYSADSSAGTQNTRVSGTAESTAATTTTSRADGGYVSLGARGNDTGHTTLRLQAWYLGPALTADQRTHLRALLTYHTGVAC